MGLFDKADWSREKTTLVGVRYVNNNTDLRALKRAAKMEEQSLSGWVKIAIHEKLERDGWLVEGKLPRGKLVK